MQMGVEEQICWYWRWDHKNSCTQNDKEQMSEAWVLDFEEASSSQIWTHSGYSLGHGAVEGDIVGLTQQNISDSKSKTSLGILLLGVVQGAADHLLKW